MPLDNEALVLDLIESVASEPKPYADVMEAWRTSCPRLSVWEDAVDAGLVQRTPDGSGQIVVQITPSGRSFLHARRPTSGSSQVSATH